MTGEGGSSRQHGPGCPYRGSGPGRCGVPVRGWRVCAGAQTEAPAGQGRRTARGGWGAGPHGDRSAGGPLVRRRPPQAVRGRAPSARPRRLSAPVTGAGTGVGRVGAGAVCGCCVRARAVHVGAGSAGPRPPGDGPRGRMPRVPPGGRARGARELAHGPATREVTDGPHRTRGPRAMGPCGAWAVRCVGAWGPCNAWGPRGSRVRQSRRTRRAVRARLISTRSAGRASERPVSCSQRRRRLRTVLRWQ